MHVLDKNSNLTKQSLIKHNRLERIRVGHHMRTRELMAIAEARMPI